ncbi:hypothetical protein ACFV9G_13600 [Nocardioides sp. NPDC059952]|uniref:hypothetical protein n=1 Tax=Nocardioides sp. NPDC059952 TaxID=3347014 RepID=UPI003653A5C6
MALITPADLAPFADIDEAQAAAMIADATAMAVLVAPCLGDEDSLTPEQQAATKAILRGAILRWNDTGTGAFQSQTAGPYTVQLDTRQTRRAMFYPSEIEQLQAVCAGGVTTGAFTVDTAPGWTPWDPVAAWLAAAEE